MPKVKSAKKIELEDLARIMVSGLAGLKEELKNDINKKFEFDLRLTRLEKFVGLENK